MTDRAFQQSLQRFPLLSFAFTSIVFLFTFVPLRAIAEDEILFDEVTVFFNVSGLGGKELEAVIKGEEVYLSLTDLFEYLKINHKLSDDHKVLKGFFLSENDLYVIDKAKNEIRLKDKVFPLGPDDLIETLSGLYLRSEIFGKVFGLECVFNFRSLSVNLNTKLDLPAIREKRQEMMRSNLSVLKREITADTTLSRLYPAFHFGNFDWSVISTQQENGVQDARLNLRLGTIMAGGETNLALDHDTRQDFKLQRQTYLWRYVNNDRAGLRQVKAGKIPVQSTASLYAPVLGVQLTNTPTTYRRSFGTYTLSDFTEPEWTVELYINNVLVDYVKSDASGFFTFQVPMIYGNTAIKLRYFGPWGEERFKEQKIHVPYNFLPKNEMEYTFSAGMLEDGKQSRFSRLDLKYGLGNRITVGTGVEYLSALAAKQIMPFVNASFRLGSALLLSADYTYGVRAKAVLNYRMPSDVLLELNYTRYQPGQQAVWQNFLEERKFLISKPFRTPKFSGFSRLSISQVIYPNTQQTTADLLLSASMKRVSANLSTYAQVAGVGYLNIYSNLALAFRLPARLTFRPQVQYDYKFQRINEFSAEVEKQLFSRGFLNASYQNNFNYHTRTFNLGLRFDLSFARASFSARQSNHRAVFSQSLSGGALVDAKTNYFNMNNRSNVGRGGLVIYPFLDLNANNRRDENEPKIQGLKLKVNGGRVQHNSKDTTIQVLDMEPYNSYLLELDRSSFDNIAWQLKKAAYKVTVEPNKLKLIEVPVMVSAEASGMIYGTSADSTGQGRILVHFYRDGRLAGRTLSEADGYFNFLGLSPGSYTARIDTAQLAKLNMSSTPASRPFNVALSMDGEVIGDLDFKLEKDAVNVPEATAPPVLIPGADTELVIDALSPVKGITVQELKFSQLFSIHVIPTMNLLWGSGTKSGKAVDKSLAADKNKNEAALIETGYSIIVDGFGNMSQAIKLQNNLMTQYGRPVKIFFEGSNAFQLRILGFKEKTDASALLPMLAAHGLRNASVVAPRALNQSSELKNTAVNSADQGNDIRFRVVTKILPAGDMKRARELILRTLNRSSYPVKDGNFIRLQIIGYKELAAAELASEKLSAQGLPEGYISMYRERIVPIIQKPDSGSHTLKQMPGVPRANFQQGANMRGSPEMGKASLAHVQTSPGKVIRYRLVTGKLSDEARVKATMKLVLEILNMPSIPAKDGAFFRLQISGFSTQESAGQAQQKLSSAGILQGFIAPYTEQGVKIMDR